MKTWLIIRYKLTLLVVLPFWALGQAPLIETAIVDSSDPGFRIVIAGPEYARGGIYQWLWGRHYRKEWTTPIKVPVIDLDSAFGGLTPVETGSSRQSKTLYLADKKGKRYVLRTVNKDYRAALPEITRGTFLEKLAKDQVSSGHPFSSITIPPMINAIGIYHTDPKIVFVPYTPSLGSFNKDFANTLCLLEEGASGNEETSANFGFSREVIGSEQMLLRLQEETGHKVDQAAYIRARLFDIFLGDWARNEDQWRWAAFKEGWLTIYRPIPRERDQAYTKFDGFLLKRLLGLGGADHIENFEGKIDDIGRYNFPARYLDRRLTNETGRDTWISLAKELQGLISDSLIRYSISQLPPELYPISGEEIIKKLKTRRDNLVTYANDYYSFLAKEVDVPGTGQDESFVIERLGNGRTSIAIYPLSGQVRAESSPIFSRIFSDDETKEVRLYGLEGNDVYTIRGEGKSKVLVRLVGGPDRDSVSNTSPLPGRIRYFDNYNNRVSGNVRSRLSSYPSVHRYDYRSFRYNEKGLVIFPSYSNVRGVHFNLGYKYTKHQWRKEPFGWQQRLRFNYSFSNKTFGGDYEASFNELFGKWNLFIETRYDQKLEQYFFGLGNETPFTLEKAYYRFFTREGFAGAALNRTLGIYHTVSMGGFYHSIKVLREKDQLVSDKVPFDDPSVFNLKQFAGAQVNYTYHNYNDEIVPTKGLNFTATATHSFNLKESQSVTRFETILGFYLPLSNAFSLAVRTGATTLAGDPEFYQLNWLGGGRNLRGYQRQRFYGKTSFYNNNDLRYIFNTRNFLFNGQMGLIAFFDAGRVWQPDEESNTWHTGYGAGLMLAPFGKISVTAYYGFSKESGRIHLRLGRLF